MNRWKKTMAVVGLLPIAFLLAMAPTQGGPEPATVPEPVRIAYIDLDRVADNSEMLKQRVNKVHADLEADLQVKDKAFRAKKEEWAKLRRQLAQQESILTAAQIKEKEARIGQLTDELELLQIQAKRVLDRTGRDIIEPVLDQVLETVERVAKAHKVDLVLRGDLVLFASERMDLTDAVVRELDRTLKAASNTRVSPAEPPSRRSPVGVGKKKP